MSGEVADVRSPVAHVAELARHLHVGVALLPSEDGTSTFLDRWDVTEVSLDRVAELLSRRGADVTVLRRGRRCSIVLWSGGARTVAVAWGAAAGEIPSLTTSQLASTTLCASLGGDVRTVTAMLRSSGDPSRLMRQATDHLGVSVPDGFFADASRSIRDDPHCRIVEGRTSLEAFREKLGPAGAPRTPVLPPRRSRGWLAGRLLALVVLTAALVASVVVLGAGSLRTVVLALGCVVLAAQVGTEVASRRSAGRPHV